MDYKISEDTDNSSDNSYNSSNDSMDDDVEMEEEGLPESGNLPAHHSSTDPPEGSMDLDPTTTPNQY